MTWCHWLSCRRKNQNLFEDEFFQREDVRDFLHCLREDKPGNWRHWIQYHEDIEDRVSSTNSSEDEVGYTSSQPTAFPIHMLDWRFYLLNKELEVAKLSTSHRASKSHTRGFLVQLLTYVPQVIHQAIYDGVITHETLLETSGSTTIAEVNDAIVVFADASGFTALTEKLAMREHGAEKIGDRLNQFFEPLIEIILAHGGDILKFNGDAVTVVWRPSPDGGEGADMPLAVSAARCCLRMHASVQVRSNTLAVDAIQLTLHIGIAFGQIRIMHFGGVFKRWEFIGAGAPFEEMGIAEGAAKVCETVVSPAFQAILRQQDARNDFSLRRLGPQWGAAQDYAYLEGKLETLDLQSETSDASDSALPEQDDAKRDFKSGKSLSLLTSFTPEVLALRMRSDGIVEAEIRRISVIFLCLNGLDPGTKRGDAKRLQLIMRLLQRSIYALEGSINKMMVDDKGMLVLAVFGLPPLNHFVDDPVRAVLTGYRWLNTLGEEEIVGQVGIATGMCWCGVLGNTSRREYTVLGDTVNLAARLMAKAAYGDVLVDTATYNGSRGSVDFDVMPPMELKGKTHKVHSYRFTGRLIGRRLQKQQVLESPLMSWADWPLKLRLHEKLQALSKEGGVLLLEGGPGCGKTQAVEIVRRWAKANRFSVMAGQNMNPSQTFAVPRLVWQEVFATLLGHAARDPRWNREADMVPEPRGREATDPSAMDDPRRDGDPGLGLPSVDHMSVIGRLLGAVDGGIEDYQMWLPLLSVVMPEFNVGAKGVSALLERDEVCAERAPRLGVLCSSLVQSFTAYSTEIAGSVVLIHLKKGTAYYAENDFHDMNIAKAMANLCVRGPFNSRPIIFCVVCRLGHSNEDSVSSAIKKVTSAERARNLTMDETHLYLSHLMSGEEIPPFVLEHIYEGCGGNIHSVEVLFDQLLELGVVSTEEGRTRKTFPESWALAEQWPPPGPPAFPASLTGLWLSAIEQLERGEQEVLKCAAVISLEWGYQGGPPTFSFNELFEILQCHDDTEFTYDQVVGIGEHLVLIEIFDTYRRIDPRRSSADDGTQDLLHVFRSNMLRNVVLKIQLEAKRTSVRRATRVTSIDPDSDGGSPKYHFRRGGKSRSSATNTPEVQ